MFMKRNAVLCWFYAHQTFFIILNSYNLNPTFDKILKFSLERKNLKDILDNVKSNSKAGAPATFSISALMKYGLLKPKNADIL